MPPSHPTNPISFLPGRSTVAFPGRREPASPRRGAETGEPAHAGRSLQESGLRARRGEADRNPRVPPSPPLPAPSRRQSPAGEGGGEASPEARSAPARPGAAGPGQRDAAKGARGPLTCRGGAAGGRRAPRSRPGGKRRRPPGRARSCRPVYAGGQSDGSRRAPRRPRPGSPSPSPRALPWGRGRGLPPP